MTGRVPTIRGTAWGNLVAVGEEGVHNRSSNNAHIILDSKKSKNLKFVSYPGQLKGPFLQPSLFKNEKM